MQVGPDSPSNIANLRFLKGESLEDRAHRVENLLPTRLNPPGLKEIKQEVELYTKFHKFIKPENWARTCPCPGDDMIDRIRKQRNVKNVTKKKRKDSIMQGNNAR